MDWKAIQMILDFGKLVLNNYIHFQITNFCYALQITILPTNQF